MPQEEFGSLVSGGRADRSAVGGPLYTWQLGREDPARGCSGRWSGTWSATGERGLPPGVDVEHDQHGRGWVLGARAWAGCASRSRTHRRVGLDFRLRRSCAWSIVDLSCR